MNSFKLRFKALLSNRPLFLEILFLLFTLSSLVLKSYYFQFSNDILFTNGIANSCAVISNICILTIAISLCFVFSNKRRKKVIFFLSVIISILLLSDTVYFRYYHNPLTVPVILLQLGLIGSLGNSIGGLLTIRDLLFLADIPIMIAWIVLSNRRPLFSIPFKKRLVTGAVILLSTLAFFLTASHSWVIDRNSFVYDRNYVIKYLGIYYFHYYDTSNFIKDNISRSKPLTVEEKDTVNKYFKQKQQESKAEKKYTGIAKGKNLIIIQMEAIQQFFINSTINGKQITPNMNKLASESAYFPNFFSQIGGGNTSDAELLTNTSTYPAKDGAVYFRFPLNTFNSLPKLLKKEGYSVYSSHAYQASFWNRTTMHRTLGFDKFFSEKDFTLDEKLGWGLGDSSFLRQSLDKVRAHTPFYGFFITLTSHYPYEATAKSDFNAGEYEGKMLGKYMKAANYADKSIGDLVAYMKKLGLYDNTVLVIYGDHFGMPRHQGEDIQKYLNFSGTDFDWMKMNKVPYIIHYPGLLNGKVISTTGGQLDTLPTVANILGIDVPYAFGKDLVNAKEGSGYAVLRNGSVATDKFYYVSSISKAFDAQNGSPVDIEKYKKELQTHHHELKVSDIIMNKDGFKKLGDFLK